MKSKFRENINLVLILGIVLLLSIGIFYPLADHNLKSEMQIKSSRYNQKRSLKGIDNNISSSQHIIRELNPQICSDGSGGAIIVWEDHRISFSNIYAQYVNSTGQVKWTIDGEPICIAEKDQGSPQLCNNGVGDTIIVWEDHRNSVQELYTQQINTTGHNQWSTNGIQIGIEGGWQWEWDHQMCSDDSGGAIIVWQDSRLSDYDIYAQNINSTGNIQWTINDKQICTAIDDQEDPKLIPDGVGGAFIIWEDWRNPSIDIYGQRLNSSGDVQWSSDGVPICTEIGEQYWPETCSDGKGGVIITWLDYRNPGDSDIYAQHVNSTGHIQWIENGVQICTASHDQYLPQICSDGNGGAFITWIDWRNPEDSDIYAQHINSTGHIQWITNGTPICLTDGFISNPKILNDESGGALIFWSEEEYYSYETHIYGQRLNSSGDVQWSSDGVPICTEIGYQYRPEICNDGKGGAIIMYLDNRNGVDYDLYAQRVNSTGDIKWGANGVPICTVIEVVDRHYIPNGDDDDDEKEEEAIPGYSLVIVIAMIGVISIIIARKFRKHKQR